MACQTTQSLVSLESGKSEKEVIKLHKDQQFRKHSVTYNIQGPQRKSRRTKIVSGSREDSTGSNDGTPYVETILIGSKDSLSQSDHNNVQSSSSHWLSPDISSQQRSTIGKKLVAIPEERTSVSSSSSSSEQDPLFQFAMRSIRRETRNKVRHR